METPAFHLHEQFIAELHERINAPGEAGTLLTGIGTELRPDEIPSRKRLAVLLDAVFWASHEQEEGVSVTVSLIYRHEGISGALWNISLFSKLMSS